MKPKKTVITVVSDLHAGSTWGLCPPDVPLSEEGKYQPSVYQEWLWERWIGFWSFVADMTNKRGLRKIVVVNGDAIEGNHHRNEEIISQDPLIHTDIAQMCLEAAFMIHKPDHVIFIRGTEAHVGGGGRYDNLLATRFKEYIPHDKPYSRYSAILNVNGLLMHFTHHTGGWGRPWTATGAAGRESAIMRDYAVQKWLRFGDENTPPEIPHLSVRSHAHKFNDSGLATRPRVIVTPSWQLSTAYGRKIAPTNLPDVGGVIFRVDKDGVYSIIEKRYNVGETSDAARVELGVDNG